MLADHALVVRDEAAVDLAPIEPPNRSQRARFHAGIVHATGHDPVDLVREVEGVMAARQKTVLPRRDEIHRPSRLHPDHGKPRAFEVEALVRGLAGVRIEAEQRIGARLDRQPALPVALVVADAMFGRADGIDVEQRRAATVETVDVAFDQVIACAMVPCMT